MTNDQLLASVFEIDITPPEGYYLDGYSVRKEKSQGAHDPLMGQILLVKSSNRQLAIICLDLIAVGINFTSIIRKGIQENIGIPPENILVSCSHTHSGPVGFMPSFPGSISSDNPELQRYVSQQLVVAALLANNQLQPVQIGIGRGMIEGIGLNRNDAYAITDKEVIVLRLDSMSGNPIAVLMNYGCHPTVLGFTNLQYSADFPGAARANLRKIYPDTVFMYTNGASGDVSTRFTRREQTFQEVERMGRILSGEVLKVMQHITTHPDSRLFAHVEPVILPFRNFPSRSEAELELRTLKQELKALQRSGAELSAIHKATTRVEGATGQLLMGEGLEGIMSYESQIQVMMIGDLALIGLPGEPFTKTVLEIKQTSPIPDTAVVSYANDSRGYFPDDETIAKRSYEALISPYGAEVSAGLRDTALTILRRK
ncbi:MAG: neutral/alkaline non-lysosomal ceramidase N-terminal domain-containing protein [Anaerolineales bacterium]|nr:neutral/alkaline non-lysosomal ceramidase N-terminal domain-containing protein [Anaerolineales bacterium]